MSKYTTEIRYICEHYSGLNESKGYNSISEIIANSRNKIFDFPYPIYNESYRSILETKILKHFYTREIGEETVGLWKLRLDMKLNEIMPYYNKMYEAELDNINPFFSTDIRTERQTVGSSNRTTGEEIDDINVGSNSAKNDSSSFVNSKSMGRDVNSTDSKVTNRGLNDRGDVSESKSVDLYSETPQGSLQGINDDVPTYLTNARKVSNDAISNGHTYTVDTGESNTDTTSLNTNENETSETVNQSSEQSNTNKYNRDRNVSEDANSTERFIEHTYGYNGYIPSELLKKYRDVIWNVDMMIIDELEPLFMQLW